MNKIDVYTQTTGDTLITDGDLHDESLSLEKHEGEVLVNNGTAAGLVFAVNDGVIDDARLFLEGSPFTGSLTIDGLSVLDNSGKPLSLEIEGKAFQNSSALTAFAFKKGFEDIFGWGGLGNLIVTISVFFFGFSTIISWSYYGDRSVEYLFGVKYVPYYRILFVFFTFLGSILALETVWAYGSLALGLMSVPNLIAVILLSPVLVKLSKDYFSREHRRYK